MMVVIICTNNTKYSRRHVRKILTNHKAQRLLEALLQAGKLDALSNNVCRRIVDVNIAEPQVCWPILGFSKSVSAFQFGRSMLTDDKLQRVTGAFADTFIEKKLDSHASLDRNSILLLPPGDGTVFRFNEALAER